MKIVTLSQAVLQCTRGYACPNISELGLWCMFGALLVKSSALSHALVILYYYAQYTPILSYHRVKKSDTQHLCSTSLYSIKTYEI
jgi:hypothetical protein